MPFERYLRADEDSGVAYDHGSCSQFSHPAASNAVQFQIPHFMLDGPPILAPGGGAEVLPAGLLDSPHSLASSWLTNSGFVPFNSAARHQQADSEPTSSIAFDLLPYGSPDHHVFHTSFPPAPAPVFTENHLAESDQVSPPSSYQSHLQPALSYPFFVPPRISAPPTAPLPMSSALAGAVYSTSGFDLLSLLARVANRPYPIVNLGPVDLSCSFTVADVRRHDSPIVYASPSFYRLTGYSEQEVIGRNCRFLQSPTGHVARGEVRQSVLRDAVAYMRKALASGKECQASLVNYRKGGQPFINLVTVIPLRGGVHGRSNEADDIVYHVGFQVDLTEQPRVLDQLRNGSYCTSYGTWTSPGIPNSLATPEQMAGAGTLVLPPRSSKTSHLIGGAVSRDLRNLITDNTFADAVPISTSVNISGTVAPDPGGTTTPLSSLSAPASNPVPVTIPSSSAILTGALSTPLAPISPALSLLLLELLPDFLLVLSLKGSFLYVAPSVRLVLGYEPHELVGRSIADVCHPADLVPLMRELKEGSISAGGTLGGSGSTATCPPASPGDGAHPLGVPKPVDLLFRAAPKTTVHPLPPFSHTTSALPLTTNSATPVACSDTPTESSASDSESTSRPYVWLECRGRLHVEPGKGRKAIILSGRARWMPIVRWDTIKRVGGVGVGVLGASSSSEPNPQAVTAGQGSKEGSPAEHQEFWALLAPAGTFLVASAGVRDILGWGVGEIIGRSLWGMVGDGMASSAAIRAQVERELARLSEEEVRMLWPELHGLNSMLSSQVIAETGNPKPTVLSVTLVTRSGHAVPVRIVFYRTPRAHTHLPTGGLANPRGNPLCPLVCQVSVLPPGAPIGMVSVSSASCPNSSREAAVGSGEAGPRIIRPGDTALFEELDTARGSSWQYELQQLKFANQRLHEELETLEGIGTDALATESVAADNSTNGVSSIPTSMSGLAAPPQPSPLNKLHAETPYHSLFPHGSPGTLCQSRPAAQTSEHDRAHASDIIDWSSIVSHGLSVPLKRAWNSDDRAI
ncbi:PAS domain-containing protein [Pisolithus albus]|nr:PAS domain-containing protein [Pisolithus albus]